MTWFTQLLPWLSCLCCGLVWLADNAARVVALLWLYRQVRRRGEG